MASMVPIFVMSSQKQGCLPSETSGESHAGMTFRTKLILHARRDYVNQEDLMKAARKVGDAKKHECALSHHSPKISSHPLHSETRVHGLIRSNTFVMLCVCSHPQHCFRIPVLRLLPHPKIYSKCPYVSFPRVRRKGVN